MGSYFLLKILVSVSVVIGLSVLAEKLSPKIAGILAGYPTGSAISLFFFGMEISPEFAAESSVYNMIGLSATMTFVYFYYLGTEIFKKLNMLYSSLFAITAYSITLWLLHLISVDRIFAFLIPLLFATLFIYLFRDIKDVKITTRAGTGKWVTALRAFLVASIILVITSVPEMVGVAWAGLLSGFPSTIFPLILIIHYSYSKEHVHTIIKNVPIGMGSVILYSLTISVVYPLIGIYLGTVLSLMVSTFYLILYGKIRRYLPWQ